jgi:hypothetical protein
VQNGVDECQEAYVPREKLEELLKLCEQIIAEPKQAIELMPTRSGFFFGSTEYDDWYMGDIQFTADRIKKILSDPAFEKADFYYQSSW